MIEKIIPKDIREYQARQVGPFTTRQCICLVIAAIFVLIYIKTGYKYVPERMNTFLPVLIAFIPCSFTLEINDMKFEKNLFYYVRNFIIAPAVRKYRVSPLEEYNTKDKTILSKKEQKELAKKRKKEQKIIKKSREQEIYIF